jgi:hypothetical protein
LRDRYVDFGPTLAVEKLAVPPRLEDDAHRPWTKGLCALDEQLAVWEDRTLSKALTFSAAGARHCIRTSGAGIVMRGAKGVVRHFLDGGMDVVWKDRILPHTTFRRLPGATTVEDDKTLDARVDAIVAAKAARGTENTPRPGPVDGSGYEGARPDHSPTVRTSATDGRRQGTSLLCSRWGHFYFGATSFAAFFTTSKSIGKL